VDWRATLEHVPLTIENDHIAPMHGGKEASRPRSPVLAPSGNPTTPFSSNQAAIVTTCKRHDHHHHHCHHHHHRDQAHCSGTVADVLTSPCFRRGMALCRIPWTAHEVRGSVAKVAVGPQCSGLALSSVNTYSRLFYHTDP